MAVTELAKGQGQHISNEVRHKITLETVMKPSIPPITSAQGKEPPK